MGMLHFHPHNVHRVRRDGREILFHVPTTSLFEIDELDGEVLDLFAEKRSVAQADVRHRFGDRVSPAEVAQRIQAFVDLGVVSDGVDAPADRPAVQIGAFPLTTIVLNVNTGCNLSCSYCYKEDLAAPAHGDRMDFATARKAIELLLHESPDRQSYNIVFFGGEPLSNMALIREVVDYAEPLFAERGARVDFTLTTNATLLTEELVDWFDRHRFGLTISMDGPRALHDRNRRTVGGQGTYDVVAAKARMLLERYRSRPVGARVTLTRGVTDVVGIWRHLQAELGFHEVGFAPVTSGPMQAFRLGGDELTAVFDNMKTLGRHYLEAAVAGRNIGFSNLHQLMTDLYEGRSKALPCGAGVGMLAVDNAGALNLCHRFTGSEMDTFGSVDDGIDRMPLASFLEQRAGRADKACATCRIRNLCAGGCYHESYAHFSDPLVPTYHYCDLMRDWIDFGIEVYSEILARNPAFFTDHILPRRAYGK